MYSKNGSFGKVRLAHLPLSLQKDSLFSFLNIGWHQCNDEYAITRPQGGTALFLFTVGGEGCMEIGNTHYALRPGSVAFIPKDTPCRYYTPKKGEWEFYWLHPTGTHTELLLAQDFPTFVADMDLTFPYAQRIEELLSICAQYHGKNVFLLSAKLSEILHHAIADLCCIHNTLSLVEHAKTYMEQRFYLPLTIDEIASELFITPTHLIRVFKKECGCTPHQYLLQYRLQTACHLLKISMLDVKEIATTVGFASTSLFIMRFREKYGITPTQYRKQ